MNKLLLFLIVLLSFDINAAFRARYSSYKHLNGKKQSGESHDTSSVCLDYVTQDILAGIWDGWDTNAGFDFINDAKGDLSNASQAHAAYWVDSLNEEISSGLALFTNWVYPEHYLKDNITQEGAGEVIWLAGAINMNSGLETMEITLSGGGAVFIDLDLNGQIDWTSDEELVWGGRFDSFRSSGISPSAGKTGKDELSEFQVEFNTSTLYKMLIMVYNDGNATAAKLYWNDEPVRALTFGILKGPPGVRIKSFNLDDETFNYTSELSLGYCQQVTVILESFGNITAYEGMFLFDFDGDAVADDSNTTGEARWVPKIDNKGKNINPIFTVRRESDSLVSKSATQLGYPVTFSIDEQCSSSTANKTVIFKDYKIGQQINIEGMNIINLTGQIVTVNMYNLMGLRIKSFKVNTSNYNLNHLKLSPGLYLFEFNLNAVTIKKPTCFWIK